MRAISIALLLIATPAAAFDTSTLGQYGSLMLDDLTKLIDQSPKLKQEIDQMLAEKHRTADKVICGGQRFPREWEAFGGRRVAPYDCNFGGKWLYIGADVRIMGPNGVEYKATSDDAMRDADTVTETNLVWHWSDRASWDK